MTLDEDHIAEPDSSVQKPEKEFAKPKGATKKLKPRDVGIGSALIIGGVIGLLWLNRGLVSQNAISWALTSKGVANQIEIENFDANGLKFKSIRIGKIGEETIIAHNGRIDWHYEFGGNGLIIDGIRAQTVLGNFTIGKAGVDFGALSPLLKSDPSKKSVKIKNIDIESVNLRFNSEYGLLRAHLGLVGSQERGFSGIAKLFLPQQFLSNRSFYEKPIFLGFKTSSFAPDNVNYIGLSALIKGQSFVGGNFLKDLEATKIDGKINASIIMTPKANSRAGGLYFNIYPSQIDFARISPFEGIDILSGRFLIDKAYINPNKNFAKNSIFSLKSELDFAVGNLGAQSLENARSKLEFARAMDGTTFASANIITDAVRGPSSAAATQLSLKISTKIRDIAHVLDNDFNGRIDLDGSVKRARLSFADRDFFTQNGLGDLEKVVNLNLGANFSKSEGQILLTLIGPQKISGSQKSQITFVPIQLNDRTSNLVFKNNQGQWTSQVFGSGDLIGNNNEGAKLNAKLGSFVLQGSNFGVRAHDISFEKVPMLEARASGFLSAADFSINNQTRSGNLDGQIVISQNGNIKLSPSKLNLRARMQNNLGEIALSGNLHNFSGFGSRFDYSSLRLNGDFAIKSANQKSRFVGNFKIDNRLSNFDYANDLKIQNVAIIGDMDLDLALGNQGANNQEFIARSKSAQFAADLIRTKDFSVTNFQTNSPFVISGFVDSAKKLHFSSSLNQVSARASQIASKDINGTNFALRGNAIISGSGGEIELKGNSCLDYSLNSLRINLNTISKTQGQICPDGNSRFAEFSQGNMAFFASANTNNFKLQMGDITNGQNLDLGQITAKFAPRPNGAMGIDIATEKFSYRFKSGPDSWAIIEAPSAKIDVNSRQNGSDFTVSLDSLITKNLPILAKGAANGKFHSDPQTGLTGEFKFANILIQDGQELKRFGDLTLGGSGQLRNGQISINAEAKNTLVGAPLAAFSLLHNLENGVGNIAFEAAQVEFSPSSRKSLQAKDIVPALQGIVEDASGKINGNANFSWAPNKPIQSSGVFSTEKFDFLSPLGPAENISGTIAIADLLKLRTEVRQDVKVGVFHPGVPILDGKVGISFPGDDSIQLEEASWPFTDGTLRLRPANWPFSAKDKDLTIDVDDIDVAKFLRLTQIKNLEIDGRMTGFLPIQIRDNEVYIVGGLLRAKDGGSVRYTGPDVKGEKPKPTGMLKLRERMFGKPPPQGIELAIEALRDLKYKVLEIRVDGRITGDIKVGVLLEGYNKRVFDGHPFLFRINISVPLMQAVNGFKDVLDPNKRFNFLNPDGTLKDNVEIEGVPTNSQPAPQK